MTFKTLMLAWSDDGEFASAASKVASDLGLKIKNVYRWRDEDSIPAGWFVPLIDSARKRGIKGVTAAELAKLAAQRRVTKPIRTKREARV